MGIVVAHFDQHVVRAINDHAAAGPSISSIDGDTGAGTGEAVCAGGVSAAADNSACGYTVNFKLNLVDAGVIRSGCLNIGECAADRAGGRVAYCERRTDEPDKAGAA